MMRFLMMCVVTLLLVSSAAAQTPPPATAQTANPELVGRLARVLGATPPQAEGAAGREKITAGAVRGRTSARSNQYRSTSTRAWARAAVAATRPSSQLGIAVRRPVVMTRAASAHAHSF